MALTFNGVAVTVPSPDLPSGYSRPAVTDFDDYELQYLDREFTVAKAGVENASETVTFAAIRSALDTAIQALISADVDVTGLTVTAYANWKIIATNFSNGSVKYTDGAINYVCTCDIFIKTA